jgi:hypothetical protein
MLSPFTRWLNRDLTEEQPGALQNSQSQPVDELPRPAFGIWLHQPRTRPNLKHAVPEI